MKRQVQKFNIVCVTKRRKDDKGWPSWHLPIYGIAKTVTKGELVETYLKVRGTKIDGEVSVSFRGITGKLLYVRKGLNGTALTLAVEISDPRSTYDVWELYTDTPTDKQLPSAIRVIAAHEVDRHALQSSKAEEATRRLLNW